MGHVVLSGSSKVGLEPGAGVDTGHTLSSMLLLFEVTGSTLGKVSAGNVLGVLCGSL